MDECFAIEPQERATKISQSLTLTGALTHCGYSGFRRMLEEPMNEDMVYGLEAEENILYEPDVSDHSERFYFTQTTGPNGEELPIVFDDHLEVV